MSETIALARLALQKQRLSLIVTSSLVALGVATALVLSASGVPSDQNFGITALAVTMVPAVVWTFAMFVFGSDRDVLLGESGYLHWMLRLPIADWKLALVPVTLKTIWTSSLWITFALTCGAITGVRPYVFGPAIGFSTVGIWLMVLMWRPFTNGWWRLLALIVCGLILYALAVGVLVELDRKARDSAPWLQPVVTAGTYGMFALGVWMSVRAVHLARTNPLGLIPETGKAISAEAAGDWQVCHHSSSRAALVWHDLQKHREVIRWFVVLGLIPATILFTVFMPFSMVGYIAVMVMFTYFSFGSSAAVFDRTDKGNIVLPPYLAASPLGTATIAWTRLSTMVAIIVIVLSCSLVIFVGWTLFPGNRLTWNRWAGEMAEATGFPSAGLRIATATLLATCLVVIGRGISYAWTAFCRRPWVQWSAIVIFSLGYTIPIVVGIVWFLQQTSWESARENALYWLTYLPMIVALWLVVKAIGVVISIVQLRSRRLASTKAITCIIAGWALVTCSTALAFHLLIPYPQATLLWCLAAVAICLPLARILVLPVSLYFGRHL